MKSLLLLFCSLLVISCAKANADSHSVLCVAGELDAPYYPALELAIQEWNDTVGTEMTMKIGDCTISDVKVSEVSSVEGNRLAVTSVYADSSNTLEVRSGLLDDQIGDELDRNLVWHEVGVTPGLLGGDNVRSIFLHELGHVLGLHHSPNPEDVMYGAVRDHAHLTANDIQAYYNR